MTKKQARDEHRKALIWYYTKALVEVSVATGTDDTFRLKQREAYLQHLVCDLVGEKRRYATPEEMVDPELALMNAARLGARMHEDTRKDEQ